MSKQIQSAASYVAVDGTQRGVRHGHFEACVATAEQVLASLPKGGVYTTRQLAVEYNLPGYAIRTAAMRAFARDQSVMLARKQSAQNVRYLIAIQ